MIDQKWDYPTMGQCATELDKLKTRSNLNKQSMDQAFEILASAVQAETGKAFVAAYSEHVASIQMFAQILEAEATLLRTNANRMKTEDERIADEVRRTFMV